MQGKDFLKKMFTVVPVDSALVIEIETNFVERVLLVDGVHDGLLSFRVTQTQCMADLVDHDVREISALTVGIVEHPGLEVVEVNIAVQWARLLVIRVKRVGQNVCQVPATVKFELITMLSLRHTKM